MNDPNAASRRLPEEDAGTILEPIDGQYSQQAQHSPYGQPAAQRAAAVASTGRQTGLPPHVRTSVEPLPAGGPSWAAPPAGSFGGTSGGPVQEAVFRPSTRPPTPRLTLLDDGASTEGEVVRIRDQVTVIGRNDGQIRLPHDALVSGKHAEVVREGSGVASRWILHDLGSSNGTFVCCSKTILRPDRLIMLGSRRYRFRLPQAAARQGAAAPTTLMADTGNLAEQMWPALVETTQPDSKSQILLAGMSLSVGRPGCGHRIELDDPLIASHHADIRRENSGDWVIEAKPSKNSIWVQIQAIRLSNMCRFQCGEQRFLFVV